MACGAAFIIDEAQEFASTQDALDDLHVTFATTSRVRSQNKPTLDLPAAARQLGRHTQQEHTCGVLFWLRE